MELRIQAPRRGRLAALASRRARQSRRHPRCGRPTIKRPAATPC